MKTVAQNCQNVASNGGGPSSRESGGPPVYPPPSSRPPYLLSHGALPFADVLHRLNVTTPSPPSPPRKINDPPAPISLSNHRHLLRSLLLLTLATGADINSSYTLGHSLSCFLVMVWSRKFAGTKVRGEATVSVAGRRKRRDLGRGQLPLSVTVTVGYSTVRWLFCIPGVQ